MVDIELEAIEEKTVEEGEMEDNDVEFANEGKMRLRNKRWTATMELKKKRDVLRMIKKNWMRMTISVE